MKSKAIVMLAGTDSICSESGWGGLRYSSGSMRVQSIPTKAKKRLPPLSKLDRKQSLHTLFLNVRNFIFNKKQSLRFYAFESLAKGVAPFLVNQGQVKRVLLFREFWQHVEMV
jgi:hypothetical protein